MITKEQEFKILEKISYFYAEICHANKEYHNSNYNWETAKKFYQLELEINKEQGEKYLLALIGVK